MQSLESIIHKLTLRLAQIGQAALVLVMLVIVANILMRAVWKPLPGSYEMVEILGAILLSMGIAHCAVYKGHVSVSFFVDNLLAKTRAIIDAFINMIFFVVISFISWGMIEYATKMFYKGRATTSLGIPLYPVYYLVGFGLIVLSLVILMLIINSIREIFRKGDNA